MFHHQAFGGRRHNRRRMVKESGLEEATSEPLEIHTFDQVNEQLVYNVTRQKLNRCMSDHNWTTERRGGSSAITCVIAAVWEIGVVIRSSTSVPPFFCAWIFPTGI